MTNPAPQPHADDVKLAETQWFERVSERLCDDKFGEMDDKDIPSAVAKIFNDDPPPELRLSNEALRERVKELELACLNLNNDLTGQGAYINIIRDKLTAASEVIEKVTQWRAFLSHAPDCPISVNYHGPCCNLGCHCGLSNIQAAIKEWEQQNPTL